MKYDVIIIGGGAAGLTAALYASRRNLKTLILSQDIGGQGTMASTIENYPGIEEIKGPSLMMNFMNQAKKFGAEIKMGEVSEVKKISEGLSISISSGENFESHSLILAFGLSHRHLDVPGEKELIGKGVAYCATCDAPLYKGKNVAVVGGGNSALDAALLLAQNSPKVYLIHRRDKFAGEAVLVSQVEKNEKIEIIYNAEVKEIKGKNFVEKIIVSAGEKDKELTVEGVFVEIGFEVKADFIKDLVKQDQRRQIIIDKDNKTSQDGIFAAGDATDISHKQVVISAGEGAKAALSAHKYLQEKGLTKGGGIDWGQRK